MIGEEWGPNGFVGVGTKVVGACVEGMVGRHCNIWRWAHIMEGAFIGDNCMIGMSVFVADDVHIGNGTRIQNHTNVSRGCRIGNNVYIGAGVQFCNSRHPDAEGTDTLQRITIEDGASIGSNVCIMGGVTIGAGAVIGANAVVTHDVPASVTAMGVPCRVKQDPEWDESGVTS